MALGYGAKVIATTRDPNRPEGDGAREATAVGSGSIVSAAYGTTLGSDSQATALRATAIGYGALATEEGAVALGTGSKNRRNC
ncbi:hypothetical protein ACLSYX_07515 [[Pasteurella] aerogenes]